MAGLDRGGSSVGTLGQAPLEGSARNVGRGLFFFASACVPFIRTAQTSFTKSEVSPLLGRPFASKLIKAELVANSLTLPRPVFRAKHANEECGDLGAVSVPPKRCIEQRPIIAQPQIAQSYGLDRAIPAVSVCDQFSGLLVSQPLS